jgi:WD40 repeat protein
VGAIALVLLLTLAIGGPLAAARYRTLAEEQRRLLYASDMKAAYQAIEMSNMGQAVDYLKRHEPLGNQPDPREFTWHYLRRLCRPYEEMPVLDHGIDVVYLALTRDGKRLVAGGPLGRITMWDIESRSLLHRFNTGEEVLTGPMTFSPDGHFLVATGHGPWISSVGLQIWDIADLTNWKRVYHNRDLAGYDGEFSPDGSLLAVPTGSAIVLMTMGETPPHPLRSITRSVRTARFSPDGSRMVTGAWNTNHAILWRVADGALLGVFTNHTVSGTVHAAVFSPDGREIASVGQDDTVRLWDASSMEELGRSYEHDVSPGALDFSREDWLVASGGRNGLVKLWNVKAGTVRELRGHSKTVKAVKFIPGAGMLASGSMDHTVRIWKLNEQQPNDILEGRPNIHLPIAFHSPIAFSPPESGLIATASMNGEDILLWDKDSGELRKRLRGSASDVLTVRPPEEAARMDALEIDRFGVVDDLAWSSNGVLAAARTFDSSLTGTGSARYRIEFWDFRRGSVTNSFEGRAPICFSGGGRLFAWQGAEKGTIHWRDFGTGRAGNARQKVFRNIGRMGLALSSDGRVLAANGEETLLWGTETGAVLGIAFPADVPDGPLDSMVFSPDDTLLIGGGESGDIYVWDLVKHEELTTLTSHPGRVSSLAISPDGKTLASGDANGLIKLWALERHRGSFGSRRQVRELLTLRANKEGVDNLRFSPDGTVLASCGAEGAVRLWRAR